MRHLLLALILGMLIVTATQAADPVERAVLRPAHLEGVVPAIDRDYRKERVRCLVGMRSLGIAVNSMDDRVFGDAGRALKDAELKLKQSGLTVDGLADDVLLIDVLPIGQSFTRGPFVFVASADLVQKATLERFPDWHRRATTWHQLIVARGGEPSADIRNAVDNLVTEFCTDYVEANPKK